MDFSPTTIQLAILSFVASIINGAVGYGFSSVVTPIALFWTTNKILNPALVLVELLVNLTLLFRERKFVRGTYVRTLPMIYGLLPGVIAGSLGLVLISATGVRIVVYALILPLTVLQLLGFQRPIHHERRAGPILGGGVGFLYALTTVSGPPLALFWRNQGLSKDEFRCAIAQIRVAEASFTAISYLILGLFTPASLLLVPPLLLPVLIGVPLGAWILRSLSRDFFSRLVMAVDGIIVSYGLYNVLVNAGYITSIEGITFVLLAVIIVTVLLVRAVARLPAITIHQERRNAAAKEAAAEASAGGLLDTPGGAPP